MGLFQTPILAPFGAPIWTPFGPSYRALGPISHLGGPQTGPKKGPFWGPKRAKMANIGSFRGHPKYPFGHALGHIWGFDPAITPNDRGINRPK